MNLKKERVSEERHSRHLLRTPLASRAGDRPGEAAVQAQRPVHARQAVALSAGRPATAYPGWLNPAPVGLTLPRGG